MNMSDIHEEDRLIHIPSDTLCIVTEKDQWGINVFHSHTFQNVRVNSDAGLSLYKEA